MSGRRVLGIGAAAVAAGAGALFLILGPLGAGAGHTQETKLEIRLTATDADPLASGKTKWEERMDNGTLERRRTSTEVEDVSTAGAHEVQVTRDADGNGTFETTVSDGEMFVEVDALGLGDLNLDSRDGDTVAIMQAGDLVEVLNPSGDVILSGALAPKG